MKDAVKNFIIKEMMNGRFGGIINRKTDREYVKDLRIRVLHLREAAAEINKWADELNNEAITIIEELEKYRFGCNRF